MAENANAPFRNRVTPCTYGACQPPTGLRHIPPLSDTPRKLQRWLDVAAYLAARRLPVFTEELWETDPNWAVGHVLQYAPEAEVVG